MFKRTIWFTVGTGVGVGGSFYAQRRLRKKIEQYYPDQVARHVSATVKSLGGDVLAAAREGRNAMKEREAALRANRK